MKSSAAVAEKLRQQVQLGQQRKRRHPADHQAEDHKSHRDPDLLQGSHRRMLRRTA
jgi:hypothetical protein